MPARHPFPTPCLTVPTSIPLVAAEVFSAMAAAAERDAFAAEREASAAKAAACERGARKRCRE